MDYQNSAKTVDDKQRLAQRWGGVFSSYAFNATLRAIITAIMARELKEPAEYAMDVVTGWFDMVPCFGRVMKELLQRTAKVAMQIKPGYRPEPIESMPIETFNRLTTSSLAFAEAAGHIIEGDTAEAEKAFKRGFVQVINAAGQLYGVPVYVLRQIYRGWLKEEEAVAEGRAPKRPMAPKRSTAPRR